MKRRSSILLIFILSVVIIFTGCGINSNKTDRNNLENIVSSEKVNTSEVETTTREDVTKNEPESETEKTNSNVSIVMVGDVLLHTPVSDSGLMEDGSYNYEHLFANVKSDIEAADVALVNQEVILGGRELGLSGYPAFNGAYEVGDAIVNAGFDVVLQATNHALDKGKTGLINCMKYWKITHPAISVLGINESEEAQNNIFIKEVNGIKIAVLNYTYGTNGIALPADMPFAVNLLDRDKIAVDVANAKQSADFVMVCPHWGTEYTNMETNEQEKWAYYFAELGVDLVIGTHPHVIEPVKWIESSTGHKTLVYYSIGNFINATSEYGPGVAARMVGAMAKVNIEKSPDGNVSIKDYAAIPLVTQMITGRGKITTYKLSDYSEELAAQNEILERDSLFSYEYCKALCNDVFGNVKH